MSSQPQLPFDVSARKHGGNPESAAANRKVHASKEAQRERVYKYVASCGYFGSTAKECAEYFGVGLNTLSGRFSELKMVGRLLKTTRRREGGAVLDGLAAIRYFDFQNHSD